MYKFATAFGVDIGRTGIRYGIVRYDGKVLYQRRLQYSRQRTREAVLRKLREGIRELIEVATRLEVNPLCIGLGTPGFVEIQSGKVLGAALHIRGWQDVPLGALVSSEIQLPAFVDNDATLQGYAEWLFGAAIDRENVLYVSLRSGIGAAIVVNRKLYRGNNNAAGEFGQMTINFKGKLNRLGTRGSLESYAGAGALVKHYNRLVKKHGHPDQVCKTAKPVFERFSQGEPLAREAVSKNAAFLGLGLANLVDIFSPGLIVLGGGMALGGEEYISMIRKEVDRHALKYCSDGLVIKTARLKDQAGFIGAAHYALERLDGKIP